MANLIEENHQLSYYLKEMYRNLEAIRVKGSNKEKSGKPDVPAKVEDKVVDDENISQSENENIKKYSTLINELKNAELIHDE
jgi:hypothetical protein